MAKATSNHENNILLSLAYSYLYGKSEKVYMNGSQTCFPTCVCDMAFRNPSGSGSFVLRIVAPRELLAR